MNRKQRFVERVGTLHVPDIDWWFRVYMIRGDINETIVHEDLFENLRGKVKSIAVSYLSEEFEYIRSGFIITHFGRRGVTFSFWHWADWEGTWEYFCQSWYCYGRALTSMEPLDRKEPILCEHEIDLVAFEGAFFTELASQNAGVDEITHKFRISDVAAVAPLWLR
jgi:hypothetical protein